MKSKTLTLLTLAILLSACGGSSNSGSGLLDTNNLSGGSNGAAMLTLACPNAVSPGTTVAGFLATLTTGSGKPVTDVFVALNPTGNSSVNAPPGTEATFGANTDAMGQVPFELKVPDDAAVGSKITITGKVSSSNYTATKTCAVPVAANMFTLTKPVSGSTQSLGTANAQQVQIMWTTANGVGVKGTVVLTASKNGGFTNDPSQSAGSSPFTMDTNAKGQFGTMLYFVCGDAATSIITATSQKDSSLSDTQSVQCIDAPAKGQLTVQPGAVAAGETNASNYPKLTFMVYSETNKPLNKQSVTFNLKQAAGGGDKVSPTTSVTDASGAATAQYQPGTVKGSVVVEACLAQNSSICDSKPITVQ